MAPPVDGLENPVVGTNSGDTDPETADVAAGASGRPTGVGLFAAGIAILLPLAYSPALYSPTWAPKWAVVLVLAGVGLPLLYIERSRAGAAAAAFLGVAALSTALSANPLMSLVGLWEWGTGLLFVGSLIGAWAVGRSLSARDKDIVERCLLGSVLFVALLAVLQMTVNLTAWGLPPLFGRPTALQGNPVYLGGLLLIGLFLTARRLSSGDLRWIPGFLLITAALALAQGRVTLVLAAAAPILMLRARGVRWGALGAVLVALGWAAGATVGVWGTPDAKGEDVASAAAAAYSDREGIQPRLQTWLMSGGAVLERPILGAGPGRFLAATVPHKTLRSTRLAPNAYYSDPHNFVVEYITTTGVLGLLALGTWLFLASRGALGAFAWAASALLLFHLLQPQNAVVTPLALLALGAATPRPRERPSIRWAPAAGGSLALAVAAAFVLGHLELRLAYLDLDPQRARRAAALLAPWPQPAEREGLVLASSVARGEEPDWDLVRERFEEATRRDPGDPRWWRKLGDFERARLNVAAAEAAYRRLLEVEPWSLAAARGLREVGQARGDEKQIRYWDQRIRLIVPQ